ncbi:MAG: SRPBCC family protein [Bacteroidota bacterium]
MEARTKHRISTQKAFDRDIEWLFDYTQDFIERKNWDKQTLEIQFMDGHTKLQKGAKVWTKSVEGVIMETEYLAFDPPTKISVRMLNRSSIFKEFIGSWDYISMNHLQTKLKITYDFSLRFPYNLLKPFVFQRIQQNMAKKLDFLTAYLNENEPKDTHES